MNCCLCGAVKDLIRLSCAKGTHRICVTCNNTRYNSPLLDAAGRHIPGTHDNRCPICQAESIEPVFRAMVPRQIKLLFANHIGVTLDRYEFASDR